MKDLSYVAGEIEKGKNLPLNLSAYAKQMMSFYHRLAMIKLSMNYYTYFDMTNDVSFDKEELRILKELTEKFNDVLDVSMFSENIDIEGCVEDLNQIREKIVSVMEVVTAYVDCLRIYEHVLNRIEHRFKDEGYDEEYYNTNFTNDLMHYILSDKDSVAVNNRISEVIEQLPMRLSKNKFYEYLKDSFTLYKGAQVGTVNDFVYNLKSAGMLHIPEGFETMFPEVHELYKGLADANYKEIDADKFKDLSDRLKLASDKMSETADMYMIFAQLVNDLYTCLLSKPYALEEVEETLNGKEIMKYVLSDFRASKNVLVDENIDKITDCFVSFEGKQERIGENIAKCDHAISYALENYRQVLEENELATQFDNMAMIIKLQSGSDFVALKDDEEKLVIASDDQVTKACDELIECFKAKFDGMDRMVYRAIMSSVLSQVPVFFNNVDEIQGYINTSLMLCSDDAEKAACVEVLRIIMQG